MPKRVGRVFLGTLFLILFFSGVAFAEPLLQWDASSGDVTGYRVYYGTVSGGPYTASYAVETTSCSLYSLPLQQNVTYYFVVRAYNDGGESGNSDEVSWVMPDATPPASPQGLSIF